MVDPGEGPLFLDQAEAQRDPKNFFWDWTSPFSQGLAVWGGGGGGGGGVDGPPPPPPPSEDLNPPLGIWLVEVDERVAKYVISVWEKA